MVRVMATTSVAHLHRRGIVTRITPDVRKGPASRRGRVEETIVDLRNLVHGIVARRISRSVDRQEHPADGKDFVRLRRGRAAVRA